MIKNTNVRVELCITGDYFNTNSISEALEILPTKSWNRGDIINELKRREYTAWIYSTEATETLDINTQLKKIETLFFPKLQILKRLKEQYQLDFSIEIIFVIENKEAPAIYLNPSIIQFAANLEAIFDIDTYVN